MGAEAAVAAVEPPAPPLPTPYKDHPWSWWVSHDGETFYEHFETAAEAIDYAAKCEYSLVAECQQQDFNLSVDGDQIIELLYGQNEEMVGDGEFDRPNAGAVRRARQGRSPRRSRSGPSGTRSTSPRWSFAETRNRTPVAKQPS